jgi:hypothetical protein
MAKFISYDGVDNNNVRAEVSVMIGTGRIKEIAGRGRQSEDGTYRNVEVVFDPDNPKLTRKVYALLDTTAKDLWEYVQAAQKDGRDISFRIESQRKRAVDRTIKFEDLIHTEQVVRVLAAVDGVFSHEAKTNPKEDPTGENPSALDQAQVTPVAAPAAAPNPAARAKQMLAALAAARTAGLPTVTVDTLVALAMASGVSAEDAMAAGLDREPTRPAPTGPVGSVHAMEEKPWQLYNSDGRINAGSYLVGHASHAEQFALDHLIELYSEGKKSPVDVSDTMIAQAASVALVLLGAADQVQATVTGRPDRQKNSYNRGLYLVLDAVKNRHPVPVGGNEQAQQEWLTKVVAEASERLYGVMEIAQGRAPRPESERAAEQEAAKTAEPAPEAVAAEVVAEPVAPKPAKPAARAAKANPATAPTQEPAGADLAATLLGATTVADAAPATDGATGFAPGTFPTEGQDGFVAPTKELVARLRTLCEQADVLTQMGPISDWLERRLGVRASGKVHAPALEAFIAHYEQAGPDVVRGEVLPTAA